MPFLIALLALFTPRLVVALLFFFTSWFSGIFDSLLWLILGFIFLPTTLLWFTAVSKLVRRPVDALASRGHRGRPLDPRLAGRKSPRGLASSSVRAHPALIGASSAAEQMGGLVRSSRNV